ncbi:MAG: type II secretion system protein [Patescibacteria group bacterium]
MKRGFTLFEMIVAIGVFSIIVVISLGSVLTISNAQKKAASFRVVQDNLNFALETMAKSIRVGFDYYCYDDPTPASNPLIGDYDYSDPNDCSINNSTGGNVFIFKAIDEDGSETTKAYRINKTQNGTRIEAASSETDDSETDDFIPLTGNDIEITRGVFYVSGSGSGDPEQPRVTIVLTGTAGKAGKIQSEANVQTTISQRQPDS